MDAQLNGPRPWFGRAFTAQAGRLHCVLQDAGQPQSCDRRAESDPDRGLPRSGLGTLALPEQITYNSTEAADIARAVVQLVAEAAGRGPTKARAYLERDLVTVVLSETLTRPERRLLGHGQGNAVLDARRAMHETLRQPLVDIIRQAIDRPVTSIHLDHDADADVLAIVCVFGDQPSEEILRPRTAAADETRPDPGAGD